jgi:membrane-associated phospholipid phosphatase
MIGRRRWAACRLGVGLAGLAMTGRAVRHDGIGPGEASVFHAVNDLPDRLYPPGWLVMQAGNALAPLLVGAVTWCTGRRQPAARLVVSGLSTWALAKAVKRVYRRPRPRGLLAEVRFRGPEPSGLGYVSGHAGIAVAIGMALYPELGPVGRVVTAAAAPTVGLCRIYVGAHLPLDVLGGAALGLAVDAVVSQLLEDRPRSTGDR